MKTKQSCAISNIAALSLFFGEVDFVLFGFSFIEFIRSIELSLDREGQMIDLISPMRKRNYLLNKQKISIRIKVNMSNSLISECSYGQKRTTK